MTMFSITHPATADFSQPIDSYWEASADPLAIQAAPLTTSEHCDVAVVGAGITGLSAALTLAEQGINVRVLEAGPLGWGASGRNGGFACIGSHKLPYGVMIKRYGLEATQSYYQAMRDSVELVADNLRRFAIDAWVSGSGEVTLAHHPSRISGLREEQEFLKSTFGEDTTFLSKDDLQALGLKGPAFFAGLKAQVGFGLHPLNYVRGLARAASGAGARLHAQSALLRWEETPSAHLLHTRDGRLAARHVIVATNGYTPEHISPLHRGRLLPALSSIIVTRQLSDAERAAQGWISGLMAFDSRNLLHYFRLLPNGRFLFGGRGGTDGSAAGDTAYRPVLTKAFHELFPAWRHVDVTHYWRGLVCLAYDRVPYLGALNEGKTVWTAIAYHGNGVAMGSWCGRALAHLLLGRTSEETLPPVLTRRLARFPLPAFRPLYLKGAYLWYGWQDRQ
jgi:glycine/D-amino acid oxidase-like deaminating enzyme